GKHVGGWREGGRGKLRKSQLSSTDALVTHLQNAAVKVSSSNPASGELLAEFEGTSATETNAAVDRAHQAQDEWAKLGVRQRLSVLRNFQRRLHDSKSEVARTITS